MVLHVLSMGKTLGLISSTANNTEMSRVRTLQESVHVQDGWTAGQDATKQNGANFCFNMSQERKKPSPGAQ